VQHLQLLCDPIKYKESLYSTLWWLLMPKKKKLAWWKTSFLDLKKWNGGWQSGSNGSAPA
jgi:hypothetical protein